MGELFEQLAGGGGSLPLSIPCLQNSGAMQTPPGGGGSCRGPRLRRAPPLQEAAAWVQLGPSKKQQRHFEEVVTSALSGSEPSAAGGGLGRQGTWPPESSNLCCLPAAAADHHHRNHILPLPWQPRVPSTRQARMQRAATQKGRRLWSCGPVTRARKTRERVEDTFSGGMGIGFHVLFSSFKH